MEINYLKTTPLKPSGNSTLRVTKKQVRMHRHVNSHFNLCSLEKIIMTTVTLFRNFIQLLTSIYTQSNNLQLSSGFFSAMTTPAPRVFVRNLLAFCDEASLWNLLSQMGCDRLVHKVHCVRKNQIHQDTPMVVYFSCRTLGDCHVLVQALNGKKIAGMSKYPLTAEVAAPQGTTGKASGLAPTRVKMGAVPWRSGGAAPIPPPPAPRPTPLMVSTPKAHAPLVALVHPKSLALNKQVVFNTGSDLGSLT